MVVMATTIVASMIAALLRPMVDKATEAVQDHCDFMIHIKREISNLESVLVLIEGVIQVAEEKQIENVKIRTWLRQLVDIGYEARDVLDEFVTVSASIGAKRASRSVKSRSLPYFCFSMGSGSSSVPAALPFQFRFRIANDIRKVRKRLDEMMKQKEITGLLEGGGGGGESIPPLCRPKAGPFGNKQRNNMFVGREDVKEEIMEKLLDHNNNHVHLIPIWGMGGVGKTTLAQSIYNDDRVTTKYPRKNRRWLSVGDKKFNAKDIICSIIRESGATSNYEEVGDFQEKLVEKFKWNKFLIVLDDVWDLARDEWKLLWDPLTNVRNGGFIIITTRIRNVITATNTPVPKDIKPLSYQDCWLIFESHAFVDGNADIRPDLKHIGQQIVKKLNGLPLAAEVVGCSLLNESNVKNWTNFLETQDWKLRNDDNDVMPALRWSYNRLRPHLKQCFAYCSLFPKGHVFDDRVLVEMWMAHDFIQNEKGEEQIRLEDKGVLYFKELVYASLFQCVDGKYMMHDMIHDLAKFVSNEEFAIVNGSLSSIQMEKIRHLTIICDPNYMEILSLCKSKRILTLYTTSCPKYTSKASPSINKDIFHDIFKQLKSTRVLVLFCSKITYIPDCISDLRHLRYLDLSKTSVLSLPDSLCDLYNLQTLATPLDAVLPKNTVNMANLRHLRANLTTCNGFGKLTSLQELSSISICEDGDIRELRDMRQLRGKLIINGLENVINMQDADRDLMQDKSYIDQLELVFNKDLGKTTVATEVLNAFSFPPNLSDLKIVGYSGLKSPSWMVDGKLITNLHTLKLSKCHQLELLPPLGEFNSLKSVHLDSMHKVGRLGDRFYGNGINGYTFFPLLEMLELKNMSNWKDWGDIIIKDTSVVFFPCLKNLFIFECPILVSVLPPIGYLRPPTMNASNVMGSLSCLRIRSCHGLMLLKLDSLVSLKDLSIRNCSNLTTITSAVHVGATIETLLVELCRNLKGMEFGSLQSLKKLSLLHCDELIYVPRLVAIEELTIRACENLKSVRINLEELHSLEKLLIYQCPMLELISDEASTSSSSTTSSSLPMSRLWSLQTDNRAVFAKVFEHYLVSLKEMWIKCFIGVRRFSHIEENNWQKLTLLQTLHISDCEDLESLPPEFQKLTSLKSIHMSSCPQLQSLPTGGLPLSLEKLEIIDCPMLYERCEVDSGLDWDKIKHIRERTIGSW